MCAVYLVWAAKNECDFENMENEKQTDLWEKMWQDLGCTGLVS